MFILSASSEKLAREKITDDRRPDAVISSFAGLKALFPKAPAPARDHIRRM